MPEVNGNAVQADRPTMIPTSQEDIPGSMDEVLGDEQRTQDTVQEETGKVRLKVDGQDVEVTTEELITLAQNGLSATKRFQEASALKKTATAEYQEADALKSEYSQLIAETNRMLEEWTSKNTKPSQTNDDDEAVPELGKHLTPLHAMIKNQQEIMQSMAQKLERLEGGASVQQAGIEIQRLVADHPELTEPEIREIANYTVNNGLKNLEIGYRIMFYDKAKRDPRKILSSLQTFAPAARTNDMSQADKTVSDIFKALRT